MLRYFSRVLQLVMSSFNNPIIVLDTDDTDTSSDSYEYTPATPTHSSSGSNSPKILAQNVLVNLCLEPSPNDPYMQAYNSYMQA